MYNCILMKIKGNEVTYLNDSRTHYVNFRWIYDFRYSLAKEERIKVWVKQYWERKFLGCC